MDINQMQTILQSNLKPNRYAHCLGVMDTAIILAKRFGVDEEQAAKFIKQNINCARKTPS